MDYELLEDESYPFSARREDHGWPGCGFVRKITEMKARRVADADRNEVQIEITITKIGKSRSTTLETSIVLTFEQAEVLKNALMTDNERKDRAIRAAVCANAKQAKVVLQ